MGKKRSKTAKQRQNTAVAKKLAQSFAKKLGVSAESQRQSAAVRVLAEPKTKTSIHKKKSTTKTARRRQKQQEKKTISTEAADFHREHAAMQERGQVVEWKRNNTGSRKSKKSNEGSKKEGLEFVKPTFCFLDSQKTTNQLIQETTHKVASVVGIGGPAKQNTAIMGWTSCALPANGISSQSNCTNGISCNNPFAALQDEPDEISQQASSTTTFSFAPPSFVIPPAQTPLLDHSIDPDL